MGAPKQPRARRTYQKQKHPGHPELFKRLWADPEWRANMLRRMRSGEFAREGVPDGMRRSQARKLKAVAEQEAKKVMEALEEQELLDLPHFEDPEMAKQCLHEAFVIARSPGNKQTRLQAINTVLKYTKMPPGAKEPLTLPGLDAWMQAVVMANKKDGAE